MSQCTTTAIQAADRAVDLIARRLQDDLASLNEQLSEIKYMLEYDEITDAEREALKMLRYKILALDPTCPLTFPVSPNTVLTSLELKSF